MIDIQKIKSIDLSGMFYILKDFPEQIIKANQIGIEAQFFNKKLESQNFVILGMGGSAIGGDIVRSYLNAISGNKINIIISRGYNIPSYADKSYNFIASSYSGETEETISALKQAINLNANIISITSGGTIEKISLENNIPVIKVPSGMMPRCALGYSFFTILQIFLKTDFLENNVKKGIKKAIDDTIELIKRKKEIYSNNFNEDSNPAVKIANVLLHNIPVIYSGNEILDTVNVRWRGQIQENAKSLCFGNLFPEMNHNEINSWIYPNDILHRFVAIYLFDRDYNIKIKERIFAVDRILSEKIHRTIKVESTANSLLERIFDIIYLGDWTSFYLAILYNTDPTPIPLIAKLKEELSKINF